MPQTRPVFIARRWTVNIAAVEKVLSVEKIAARETGGISKTDAVKGQILTQPVLIEKASRH